MDRDMSDSDLEREGVEWARAHVRRGMVDAPSQTPQQHAAAILSFLDRAAFDDSAALTYEMDVAAHLQRVARDRFSFDVMVSLAAAHLRAGEPMPADLATFAADVLDGGRPPEGKHRRRSGWRPEPLALGFLTSMVANRYGIKPYSTSNADAITAARVVEKALVAEKRARSYSTVEAGYKAFVKATKTSG